jgi:hypothetical protein
MTLAEAILAAMLHLSPPGNSIWSVEPVTACTNSTCRPSEFYHSLVQQETKETGTARYKKIAEALAIEVDLAVTADPKHWSKSKLAGLVLGVAVIEGGFP